MIAFVPSLEILFERDPLNPESLERDYRDNFAESILISFSSVWEPRCRETRGEPPKPPPLFPTAVPSPCQELDTFLIKRSISSVWFGAREIVPLATSVLLLLPPPFQQR